MTTNDTTQDFRLLRALRREPVDATPVWFHRQAGRYMPRYAAIAARMGFLEMCEDAAVVSEVTIEPVEAHGVDAAILFADILLVPRAMGLDVDFLPQTGPVIHHPVSGLADVERLNVDGAREKLEYVMEAVRTTKRDLAGRAPLIGFAGAPFTVASYMIEAHGSVECPVTKAFFRTQPAAWTQLMDKLTEATEQYLLDQVANGAQAIELFDSWVGTLTEAEYRTLVLPWSLRILHRLKQEGVPTIHFAPMTAHLLGAMADAGGDAIGCDWRLPLNAAWDAIGEDRAIQGNLDPTVLLTRGAPLEQAIQQVLDAAGGRDGHVFNLGHGVLRQTQPAAVTDAVDLVHTMSARR